MESRADISTEIVNVTGHTAQVDAISQLGKDPNQWITALQELERLEDGPRKHKLIKCFFTQAHRSLHAKEMRQNENYAILLGKEAMFCSGIDVENARSKFEAALTVCRTPVIYIMFAQFEVNNGKTSKAMKILQHGLLSCGNPPEIENAIDNLKKGHSEISALKCVKSHNAVKIEQKHEVMDLDTSSCQFSGQRTEMPKIFQLTTPGRLKGNSHSKNSKLSAINSELPISKISHVINHNEVSVSSPLPNISMLELDLQSPASPDLSMLYASSKKSQLTSNREIPHPLLHDQQSEAKLSTSQKKLNFETHCKKTSRLISEGPRRVLVKKSMLNCEDDDIPAKNGTAHNSTCKTNSDVKEQHHAVDTNPSESHSVQAKAPQNIQLPFPTQTADHAFKPYVKSVTSEKLEKLCVEDKENQNPISQVLESSKSGSLSDHQVRPSLRVRNSSGSTMQRIDRHSNDGNLPKIAEEKSGDKQHHTTQNLHPAHQLLLEKKILEVSGISYIVLKLLGRGGSSKVFQVLNPKTSEIFAVKQVNLVGCDEQVLSGYKNEIDFLEKLQGNRYIIKLVNHEIKERYLYLVMECGSLDLSAFLKKQKAINASLNIINILNFWENMLRAVQAIHQHGIIHLDLKPANFMLVDFNLKLIDFGIANAIQVDATSVIKDTQFGTLNYMAPETINDMSGGMQTSSGSTPKFKVGPKADVWSLGCILYYIMYGKTPFQHITHQAMKLLAITNENHKIDFPNFPRHELVKIVQMCLTRDPKKRPSVDMLLSHPLLS